jgi:hypothetical protein
MNQITPTHVYADNLNGPGFVVWRYNPTAGIPIWVVRKWHKLGPEQRMKTVSGLTAVPGDWILLHQDGRDEYTFKMTDEEFKRRIVPIP